MSSDLITTEKDPVTPRETSLSVYFLSVTLPNIDTPLRAVETRILSIPFARARIDDKVSANISSVIQYSRSNAYVGWPRNYHTYALSALDTISDLKSNSPCRKTLFPMY